MTAPIAPAPVAAIAAVAPLGDAPRAEGAGAADLAGSFTQALSEARAREAEATGAAERFAAGDPSAGIHEVMIATEKATLAVRYATTLKNKAVEAYRELMNTQV